mgnify:CR=1 FL=1
MVDTRDLKSLDCKIVRVRISSQVLYIISYIMKYDLTIGITGVKENFSTYPHLSLSELHERLKHPP